MNSNAWTIEDGRIKIGDRVYVSFERTRRLRPGDAARAPSSYGTAPLAEWKRMHGANVMVAVREDEAIWLGLSAVHDDLPCAVRVIVREPQQVDAVTGARPVEDLSDAPQNFLVVPPQHALVGVVAGDSLARQFVRVAHSEYDAESRRLHLIAYQSVRRITMRPSVPSPVLHSAVHEPARDDVDRSRFALQRIGVDPYGLDMWRGTEPMSVTVELVAPEIYSRHTGRTGPGPLSDDAKYGGWRLP